MEATGILKFVEKGQTCPTNIGVKTFPHQTFGVSRESPDHFHRRHTFVNPNGYHYKHEHAPEFEYRSQHKSIMLDHPPQKEKLPSTTPHHHLNPYQFHLKKGRMGEFLDKNGWMKNVYEMTGFERSKRSRKVNNYERSMRIKSSKKPIEYESNLTFKSGTRNPQGLQTISEMMSEKVRIRSRRNQEAVRRIPQSQKKLTDPELSLTDV